VWFCVLYALVSCLELLWVKPVPKSKLLLIVLAHTVWHILYSVVRALAYHTVVCVWMWKFYTSSAWPPVTRERGDTQTKHRWKVALAYMCKWSDGYRRGTESVVSVIMIDVVVTCCILSMDRRSLQSEEPYLSSEIQTGN